MKFYTVVTTLLGLGASITSASGAHSHVGEHARRAQRLNMRQAPGGEAGAGAGAGAGIEVGAGTGPGTDAGAAPGSGVGASGTGVGAGAGNGAGGAGAGGEVSTPTQPLEALSTDTPPLAMITKGMPTRAALLPTAVYTAGQKAPISGAPPLPTPFVKVISDWPTPHEVPPTDSPEVQEWLKELEGVDIPDLSITVSAQTNGCERNPAEAADAANRGWWTCGGHTRDTDVVNCPDKLSWGLTFDDGPSKFTQYLLNYLEAENLKATFFLLGSRVIDFPSVVLEEYMKGHELSIHTWSHKPLTGLTNAQIVAELGWTRKAIKDITGVAPTTMRPPYGDIDDRVRAISLAMGLVPVMWSQTTTGGAFDTNDWKIPDGQHDGVASLEALKLIVEDAVKMETGFIVLQHDHEDSAVHMGAGYTLPYALNFEPKLNLLPVGQCLKKPATDLYFESNTNRTFPPDLAVRSVTGVVRSGNGAMEGFSSPLILPVLVSVLAAFVL